MRPSALLVFDHWGVDPKRDKVNFRVLGDETVLAQAVANRVVDCAYNEKIGRLKAEDLLEDRFVRKIESEGRL